MKNCLLSLSFLFSTFFVNAQDSTVTNFIIFGKMEFLSHTQIKSEKFGRSSYAYNPTYFMEMKANLNNRNYQPIGLLYKKFERYCIYNKIYYNTYELKKYRRRAVAAGMLYGVAAMGFLPIYFNAQNYSNRTGYAEWPNVLFKGNLWPLFWGLPFIECITACKIKGHAERTLKNRIFLEDAYEN